MFENKILVKIKQNFVVDAKIEVVLGLEKSDKILRCVLVDNENFEVV